MDHIHFIGIGGTGLSAIAKVLLEQGYQVSGSDLQESPLFEAVKAAGGTVTLGHQAENIQGADLIIRSSAIPEDNPEIRAALSANIPVYKRSEFLGRLTANKKVLAVAGSHGKTTTTSMLAWILSDMSLDPSFIVGGVVNNLNTNARAGKGKYFVIEADEYDHMFLGLKPDLAVVTNVEHDHPDIFPTEASFVNAFQNFVKNLQPDGTLILCGEDSGSSRLVDHINQGQTVLIYGFEKNGGDYLARNLQVNTNAGTDFDLLINSGSEPDIVHISLQIPGEHNVLNSLGAFAAADCLGLDHKEIARSLSSFKGSERRFDIRGEYQGVLIIDDYAHHPTEIRATLAAARNAYPGRRIWAVWQPHTYSRTTTLSQAFAKSFSDADQVLVLNVYAARENKPSDFDITDLIAVMDHKEVTYTPGKEQAVDLLKNKLRAGDLLLVFTAGDAIEINDQVENFLSAQVRK
ncbi:MAG: UDP-N-acetylmuramate--L-alanine ligase [Anaerolineales bacterium]|nr:UDP-N-acetylmuramate--L-alanine ligase [Anaerolineales bacterium]